MISLPVIEKQTTEKTQSQPTSAKSAKVGSKKLVKLSELDVGAKGRVVRVDLSDLGCRRRFAEMGISEGMMVSVVTSGDTMILGIGGGRMGVSAQCASQVTVLRM